MRGGEDGLTASRDFNRSYANEFASPFTIELNASGAATSVGEVWKLGLGEPNKPPTYESKGGALVPTILSLTGTLEIRVQYLA